MGLTGARGAGAVILGAGLAMACMSGEARAQVTAYAFIPNSGSGTVSVIETSSGAVVGGPITVGTMPQAVGILPDGSRAYIGHISGSAVIPINVATRTTMTPIFIGSTVLGVSVHPNSSKVYVAGFGTNKVYVINPVTNTVTNNIAVGANPASVAVSPDGLRAYVTNSGGSSFSVINLVSETTIGAPIAVGVSPGGAVVTADGKYVYMANFGSNSVSIYDVDANTVLPPITVGNNPTSTALSPDGAEVAVNNYMGNSVTLFSTATRSITSTVPITKGGFGTAYTPDGTELYATRYDNSDVVRINTTTHAVSSPIAVGAAPYNLTTFMSPPIITTDCLGCAAQALSIANDAGLTAIGVRDYVIFNHGILRLAGDWTTSRHLSMLSGNGTIHTQGFTATINGNVVQTGGLGKTGSGTLVLNGTSAHTGGTTVLQGRLLVNGTHSPGITLQSGVLGGNGTVGAVGVLNDANVDPGVDGPGTLHATSVNFAPTSHFTVQLNGPAPDTGYDRLEASTGVTLNNATLHVQLGYTPPSGTVFTIMTHATGTFAGLPEGAIVTGTGGRFRIGYHGGSGSDVTLMFDAPPTITPFADASIFKNGTLGPTLFTMMDDHTSGAGFVVGATSSNPAVVPSANLVFLGTGATRTLTVTPAANATGVTTITVTVTDNVGQSTSQQFTLTVSERVYHLAEGATGGFFSTDVLIANPNSVPAPVTVTFFKEDGTNVVQDMTLPATSRTTIEVDAIAGMEGTAFSTSVLSTSSLPLIVERTMWWDATGYGAHTEKASAAAASQWYFAEGSQGYFHTYFLLLNPNAAQTTAHVTYFLEGLPAVQRDVVVPAKSRLTIDAAEDPALADQSFGALIAFDLPGMAERAMYFGPGYLGGHASSGLTAPSPTWFLAEGATGTFFDTFVLMANPNDAAANVTTTYLPENGVPVDKLHVIPGHQRLTINIATEDATLASAAVSTRVTADQPIIAERSQYWPHAAWQEAHNSAGETSTGTKWGFAEGRVGGANHAQTYVLVANPGNIAADVTATFLRTNGTTIVKTVNVPATSRFNIAVTGPGSHVPELADESFGVVIESSQPVMVERSLYTDAGGITWAAGTNATGTRLP